jgi:HEAT repeat protein
VLGTLFALVSLVTPAVAAADPPPKTVPPTAEQMAAIERLRPQVESIWKDVRSPVERDYSRYFWQVTGELLAIGPEVVPFLVSEVDLADPATYPYAAFALGHFPTPESEAALRKAVRVADARGGRFAAACKRYAVFSLALLGKADVVDMVQTGEEIQATAMVPDLLLMPHIAALVGPAANPLLAKQLEEYGANPEESQRMQYTLFALGRTGDASFLPKVLPLLQSKSTGIRAQAADTLSRIGPPDICLQLMPLLADAKQRENYAATDALVRTKPEPCYKAVVARLEVEENVGVKAGLYAVVAALGGESSLDIFRGFMGSKDYVERTLIADMIGRVGSKKGLNMLRALLADPSANVAQRALESLNAIGGEGATDTLVAMTADRRRNVALASCRILTEAGVKRAAPRIAQRLVELVREPVGELELRAPIAQLSEELVTLGYVAPVDDLRKAIEVQSDPEIKEQLTSCVTRLDLIAKNGDEPAPWIELLASPAAEIRILAARRLAEIGTAPAIAGLEARLAKPEVDGAERAWIFRGIADARAAGASALVEKNLSDPAADAWDLRDARAEAGWAARRIGGERMAGALRASAQRRQGADWTTLVYLAVLDKNSADLLKTLKTARLRRPDMRVGREDGQLAEILTELTAGRVPKLYDKAPEYLLTM